jgi:hypothetical protein
MEAVLVFIPHWGRSDRACQKDARKDVEEENECQGEKHAGVTLHDWELDGRLFLVSADF